MKATIDRLTPERASTNITLSVQQIRKLGGFDEGVPLPEAVALNLVLVPTGAKLVSVYIEQGTDHVHSFHRQKVNHDDPECPDVLTFVFADPGEDCTLQICVVMDKKITAKAF